MAEDSLLRQVLIGDAIECQDPDFRSLSWARQAM